MQITYLQLTMGQKIIQILLETSSEDPGNPFPHFALAKEYQKINDTESARKHYHHLVENFPDYGGTYYHYALLLIDEDDESEARKVIKKGLDVLQKSGETNLRNELASLLDQYFDF